MTGKKPAKPPADAGAVGSRKFNRLTGAPRSLGPAWSLSDSEKELFDRAYGVSEVVRKAQENSHPGEHDLLFNGVAAVFGFHELSKLIDELQWDDGMGDVAYELRRVRVAFELGLRALDEALKDRAKTFERARELANARLAKNPAALAMKEVKKEWERWQAGLLRYANDAAFARAMTGRYPAITSEGSIKNASSRWRKEKSSS